MEIRHFLHETAASLEDRMISGEFCVLYFSFKPITNFHILRPERFFKQAKTSSTSDQTSILLSLSDSMAEAKEGKKGWTDAERVNTTHF